MTVRTDVTVDWTVSPRVVTVLSPSATITVQDLVDTCRAQETATFDAIYDRLIDASGKDNIGGGVQVGITATLNNAVLAFQALSGPSYTQCTVSGGNLVAVDASGANINPIQPTAFTQVVVSASSSATIAAGSDPTTIAAAVWAQVLDGTLTAEQSMRLMNAILGGKVSGAGTGTEKFRDPADTKDRVVTTVDTSGNRTSIARDLT